MVVSDNYNLQFIVEAELIFHFAVDEWYYHHHGETVEIKIRRWSQCK